MKILILTGKFGMGHYAAAQALSEKLEQNSLIDEVTIIDFCEEALAGLHKLVYYSYDNLIARRPVLYNTLYRSKTAIRPPQAVGGGKHLILLLKCLQKILSEQQPDVVISTYSYCSYLMSLLKKNNKTALPLVTCITDLHSHGIWLNDCTDFYLVADQQTKRELLSYGVDKDKISVSGIPVKSCFYCTKQQKSSNDKELLLMGGGLGLLPEEMSFYRRLNAIEGLHITVVTGKNKHLFNKLNGKFASVSVLPFVNNVPELMQKADAILTKPGGITIYEAVAASLPILIYKPRLAQERENCHFLVNRGLGFYLNEKSELAVEQVELIMNSNRMLELIKANMEEIKNGLNNDGLMDFLAKREEVAG